MSEEKESCSLNIRRIDRDLVNELKHIKWISGYPLCSLIQQAVEYWLERVGRPTWLIDEPDVDDGDGDGDGAEPDLPFEVL